MTPCQRRNCTRSTSASHLATTDTSPGTQAGGSCSPRPPTNEASFPAQLRCRLSDLRHVVPSLGGIRRLPVGPAIVPEGAGHPARVQVLIEPPSGRARAPQPPGQRPAATGRPPRATAPEPPLPTHAVARRIIEPHSESRREFARPRRAALPWATPQGIPAPRGRTRRRRPAASRRLACASRRPSRTAVGSSW